MLFLTQWLFGAVSKVAPMVWGLLAALIVASLLYWSVHSSGVEHGKTAVILNLEKQHGTLEKKADRVESKVDACFASGGGWDGPHAVCLHRNQ